MKTGAKILKSRQGPSAGCREGIGPSEMQTQREFAPTCWIFTVVIREKDWRQGRRLEKAFLWSGGEGSHLFVGEAEVTPSYCPLMEWKCLLRCWLHPAPPPLWNKSVQISSIYKMYLFTYTNNMAMNVLYMSFGHVDMECCWLMCYTCVHFH